MVQYGLTIKLASRYFLFSDSCSVGSDGMAARMAPRQPCCSHLTFRVWLDGRNWPCIFCLVIAVLWINNSADLFPFGTSSLFIYYKLSKLFLGYMAVLLFILYLASSVIPDVLWSCRLGDILKEFALLKFMWIPGWWICNFAFLPLQVVYWAYIEHLKAYDLTFFFFFKFSNSDDLVCKYDWWSLVSNFNSFAQFKNYDFFYWENTENYFVLGWFAD